MRLKDADGMAYIVEPDHSDPFGSILSGFALFDQTCVSQYLVFVRYYLFILGEMEPLIELHLYLIFN